MSLQFRPFLEADWGLAQRVLTEPMLGCVSLLYNRASAEHLFVMELPYGYKLWANCRLLAEPSAEQPIPEKPVGLVLRGALEVSEHFIYEGRPRRRSTKILRPGDFFGLFEAVGGLYGFWQITAGVQRFLVTNPLGDAKALGRNGWKGVSAEQLCTLKHSKRADYDYSDLVQFALEGHHGNGGAPCPWSCTVLLFDLARIEDPEAELTILRAAVSQLASLARQNPTDSLFEDSAGAGEDAELARCPATISPVH